MSDIKLLSYWIYFLALLFSAAMGIARWRQLDKGMKIFLALLIVSILSESFGLLSKYYLKTKAPSYHVFVVIHLFVSTLYFMQIIFRRIRPLYAVVLLAFYTGLGLCNMLFFQGLSATNTYMLMFESFIVIALSLYSLYTMMIQEDIIQITRYPHFRLSIAMLVLWTGTFFFWALLNYLKQSHPVYYSRISIGQTILNIFVYIYIGFTFLRLNKDEMVA